MKEQKYFWSLNAWATAENQWKFPSIASTWVTSVEGRERKRKRKRERGKEQEKGIHCRARTKTKTPTIGRNRRLQPCDSEFPRPPSIHCHFRTDSPVRGYDRAGSVTRMVHGNGTSIELIYCDRNRGPNSHFNTIEDTSKIFFFYKNSKEKKNRIFSIALNTGSECVD